MGAAHAALRLQKPDFEPYPASAPKVSPSQIQEVARAPAAPPPAYVVASVATPMAKPQCLEGPALEKAIQDFIRQKGDGLEEGVSVADVCNHVLPAREANVRAALDKLVGDGEVFNTIDDD